MAPPGGRGRRCECCSRNSPGGAGKRRNRRKAELRRLRRLRRPLATLAVGRFGRCRSLGTDAAPFSRCRLPPVCSRPGELTSRLCESGRSISMRQQESSPQLAARKSQLESAPNRCQSKQATGELTRAIWQHNGPSGSSCATNPPERLTGLALCDSDANKCRRRQHQHQRHQHRHQQLQQRQQQLAAATGAFAGITKPRDIRQPN